MSDVNSSFSLGYCKSDGCFEGVEVVSIPSPGVLPHTPTHPHFYFPASYPVPGVGPHCHGNPSILADRPLVAHCRRWPLLHLAVITVGKRLHQDEFPFNTKGKYHEELIVIQNH